MTSGIRTLDDIRQRCVMDDITECWQWRGGHAIDGSPSIWFPPLGKRTTAGVILCWLLTGETPRPGVVWHRTCDSVGCCSPFHRKAGTRKSQMRNAKVKCSLGHRAKIAQTKRAASLLADEHCQAIRQSSETLDTLAMRYGISRSHASRIRRGELRAQTVRGSSIFNLGAP